MRTKLEKILLILGGAIVGIFISINLPVFADKTKSTNLPLDELRTFGTVKWFNNKAAECTGSCFYSFLSSNS